MIEVINQLQGSCIYYRLIKGKDCIPYIYKDYIKAEAARYGVEQYKEWQGGIDLGEYQHC